MTTRFDIYKAGLISSVPPVAWIFVAALGIRLYACFNAAIINPDGIIYIQQARALFYDHGAGITACGMHYISILPFFIAGAFSICGDWIVAGRFISLLFGTCTFFPLYFLIRRFLDSRSALFALLIYAFIPALVGRSADIIRDPVFWFFLTLGMLFFIRHTDQRSIWGIRINLSLSCCFYLLSIWARIEGLLFIIVSLTSIPFFNKKYKVDFLLAFAAPLLVILTIVGVLAASSSIPLCQLLRLNKFLPQITGFVTRYHDLQAAIDLIAESKDGPLHEFLKKAAQHIWILPFGPLFDTLFEKFFYPYVLIFFVGLWQSPSRIATDRRVHYFFWLVVGALLVLYFHLLSSWLIYDRFLSILIFPAVIFVGFGCDKILQFIETRTNLTTQTTCIILGLIIVLFGIGKNLRPRYEEKYLFVEIAEKIKKHHGSNELIRIAADSSNAYEWVFFYTNKDIPSAPCSKSLRGKMTDNDEHLISKLRREKIKYILIKSKPSTQKVSQLPLMALNGNLELLETWSYSHKETFTLLAIKP